MVYVAAGIAGLTGIVGMFFIKDYLNLSAAFLASLGFWAGLPWALKMPLGHLVDLIWKHKKSWVGTADPRREGVARPPEEGALGVQRRLGSANKYPHCACKRNSGEAREPVPMSRKKTSKTHSKQP